MDALQEAIVEWIQGERVPQSRAQVVSEITRLASHCKLWPIATASQWGEAIDATVSEELIVEVDGRLRLATAVEPEPNRVQLELF